MAGLKVSKDHPLQMVLNTAIAKRRIRRCIDARVAGTSKSAVSLTLFDEINWIKGLKVHNPSKAITTILS